MSEQLLIRGLPAGSKAALRARARRHHRNLEAEARQIMTSALAVDQATIVDLLRSDETADLTFEPARISWQPREVAR